MRAVRASRRTRIVRRGELVRVAQLALVLEVVDSARAHQVGGHVDALATPAAVGRGSQWSVMRCSHARRAGSGRAAVGSGQGGQAHPSCPASSKSKRETVVVGQLPGLGSLNCWSVDLPCPLVDIPCPSHLKRAPYVLALLQAHLRMPILWNVDYKNYILYIFWGLHIAN
jgi:hypothetical protein